MEHAGRKNRLGRRAEPRRPSDISRGSGPGPASAKPSVRRFINFNRTELYQLARALWWAASDEIINSRTVSGWERLETEVRAEVELRKLAK